MAASQQDIEYLIRARDEATRIIKQINRSLGDQGRQVEDVGRRFDKAARQAREAGSLMAGAFAQRGMWNATIGQFTKIESEFVNVAKTAGLSATQMDELKKSTRDLSREMQSIPLENLQRVQTLVGQMGASSVTDIQELTKTIVMLQSANESLNTDEGAATFARFAKLSKTAVKDYEALGSALTQLGNDAAVTEDQILNNARLIKQSTASYKMSGAEILGLATATAEAGLRAELTGSVIGRVMSALDVAAATNSTGFQRLAEMSGKTREQWQALIRDNPTEALIQFAGAVKELGADGENIDTASFVDLMQKMGLYAEENRRVIGTLAANYGDLRKFVDASGQAFKNNTALMTEYQRRAEAFQTSVTDLKNNWSLFAEAIGEAAKPALTVAFEALSSSLEYLSKLIRALPGWLSGALAIILVTAPGVLSLVAAFRLLAGAMGMLGFASVGTGLKAMIGFMVSLTSVSGAATAALGLLSATLKGIVALTTTALAPLTVAAAGGLAMWTGYANGVAIADEAVKNYRLSMDDLRKAMGEINAEKPETFEAASNAAKTASVEAKKAAVDMLAAGRKALEEAGSTWNPWTYVSKTWEAKGIADALQEQMGEIDKTKKLELDVALKITEESRRKTLKDAAAMQKELAKKGPRYFDLGDNPGAEYVTAIKNLDSYTKQAEELKMTLQGIQQLQDAINEGKIARVAGVVVTQDDVNRYRELAEYQRMMADPASAKLYDLSNELRSEAAVTQALKDQLQIEENIREVKEQKGQLTQKEIDDITEATAAIQEQRKANDMNEHLRQADEAIALAMQRTEFGRQQVEIEQQIAEIKREQNITDETALAALKEKLALANQIVRQNQLEDQLDPIGAANRSYEEQLATLKSMNLEAGRFAQLKAQLDWNTREERDPVGERVRQMREEIGLMRMGSRERDVEKQVLQELNQMRSNGVQISNELTAAVREYYTAMRDAEQADQNGLAAWSSKVGDAMDNFRKLTEDAMEGFSNALTDSIVNAVQGKSGAFRAFGLQLGRMMIDYSVKQFLADGIKMFNIGNGAKNAALDRAASAADKIDAAKALTSTATMQVQAGVVNVNGASLPGANQLTDIAKTANDNIAKTATESVKTATDTFSGLGAQEKITRQALAPITQSATETAKTLDTSAWQLRGAIDGTKDQLLDLGNGIKMTPDAFDYKQSLTAAETARVMKPVEGLRGTINDIPKQIETATKTLGEGTGQGFLKVVDSGKGFTTFQDAMGNTVKRTGTFAWRNNNPGNLEASPWTQSQPGFLKGGGRFAAFDTLENGRNARAKLLFESANYKDKSITDAITRYAPPHENDTARYISEVSKAAGVDPSTKMSALTAEQRKAFMAAQERVEGFRPGTETFLKGHEMPVTPAELPKMDIPNVDMSKQAMEFVGNYKKGVNEQLTQILEQTSKEYEALTGMDVKAISGFRPGDKRFHGKGLATDVGIYKDGKMLDNYQSIEGFQQYEQFAQMAKQNQMKMFPELNDKFRWGGYFSGKQGVYGANDPMHFDIGGSKNLGMAGGSWAGGLTDKQRALWPGIQSQGMGNDLMNWRPQGMDMMPTGSINPTQYLGASGMGGAMGMGGGLPQITQVADQFKQAMNPAITNVAQTMPQAFTQPIADVGMNFADTFSQAGSAFQNLAPQLQNVGQNLTSIVPQMGGFGQSMTSLMGPLMQAPAATGQFSQSLMQMIQQMMSQNMMGGIGGIFGGLFHGGGEVGGGGVGKFVSASAFSTAKRYHSGLKNDEFTAILQRGERVLTRKQNRDSTAMLDQLLSEREAGILSPRENRQSEAAMAGGNRYSQTFNITTPDANSFRKSQGQINADASVQMRRYGGRNT